MTEDTYLSLAFASKGLHKEKGSKFLAFAYPVSTEHEIKTHLEELKKKYQDARHHCYAYILGKNQEHFRANDDREPNHSAGGPILGQIRSNGLTNVLIVVVRYFGGAKLGVSGLINAYKTAASEAIANNKIVTRIVKDTLYIRYSYPSTNEVMRLVKEYELEIIEQEFDNECRMKLGVRLKQKEEVLNKLNLIESLRFL